MNRDTADICLKTRLPGQLALNFVARDMKVQAKSTQEYPFVRAYDEPAAGPFCTDIDGNVLMDFTAQIGVNPLGYNHPEIVDILSKLQHVAPGKFAGMDFWAASKHGFPSPTDLKEKLIEATQQFGYEKVFPVSTGTEAVEKAMKFCYDKRGRNYGIGFEGAFHGRTLGALSLNQSKRVHKQGYPSIPYILMIPYCSEDKDSCDCGFWVRDKRLGAKISKLEQLLNHEVGTIAPSEVDYILFEPVQGEGGYIIPSQDFIDELKRVSREYKIPLIADEIQTGLGRTGRLWAVEHFGIVPDLLCSSKALQVGAVIGKAKMFPDEAGRDSSTWSGGDIYNSIIGYKTVEIILRDKLWKNAEKEGRYFMSSLKSLMAKYNVITDVRCLGLMDAIEFDTAKNRNKFMDECFKRGLMVIGCGYKANRFLPPLDVTSRELDIALNVIEDALRTL